MMTASATVSTTTPSFVSSVASVTQDETRISDIEILRRVRGIRSTWTVSERMERRQEASKRFASLLEALSVDHHAA